MCILLESRRHHGTGTGDSDGVQKIGCSVCSGKVGKPAVEYSTVRLLLLLKANRTQNTHISEYEYNQ